MDKYRSFIRFGRFSDPSEKIIESWNLHWGLPEPIGVLKADGNTF